MVELPLGRYRFHFTAETPTHLSEFAGSAWRGAFGTALKRVVCATRLPTCENCPLSENCVFPSLFEGRNRPVAGRLSTLERVPVPYVFQPLQNIERVVAEGDQTAIDLTLVGTANQRLPYVVHAMTRAGARGIGRGRGRLALVAVDRLLSRDGAEAIRVNDGGAHCRVLDAAPPPIRSFTGTVIDLDVTTPLRLKIDGNLVTPQRFRPAHLIEAIVRRVSTLAEFHDAPIDADYRALKHLANTVTMSSAQFQWQEQRRYSSRQNTAMAMGGIAGRCRIDLPAEARVLIPWMVWVGVGGCEGG